MLARSLRFAKSLSLGNVVLGTLCFTTLASYFSLLLYRLYRTRLPPFLAKERACIQRVEAFVKAVAEEQQQQQLEARRSSTSAEPFLVQVRHRIFREHAHCYSVLADNGMASWGSNAAVLQLRRLAGAALDASVTWLSSPPATSFASSSVSDDGQHHALQRLLDAARNHDVPVSWRLSLLDWWLTQKLKWRGAKRAARLAWHLMQQTASGNAKDDEQNDQALLQILTDGKQQSTGNNALSSGAVPSQRDDNLLVEESVIAIERLQRAQLDASETANGGGSLFAFASRVVGSAVGALSSGVNIVRLQQRHSLRARVVALALLESTKCALLRYNRARFGVELAYSSTSLVSLGGRGAAAAVPLGLELASILLSATASRFAFAIDLQVARALSRQAAFALSMADTAAIEGFAASISSPFSGAAASTEGGDGGAGFFAAAGYGKCLEELRNVGNPAVFCVSGLVQLPVQIAFVAFDVGAVLWSAARWRLLQRSHSSAADATAAASAEKQWKTALLCLGVSVGWYLVDDGFLCGLARRIFRTPRRILQQLADDITHPAPAVDNKSTSTSNKKGGKKPLASAFDNSDVSAVVELDDEERAILADDAVVANRVIALSVTKQSHHEAVSTETLVSLRVLGLDVVATLCGLQRRQRVQLRHLVRLLGQELLDPHSNILSETLTLLRRHAAFHLAAWYFVGGNDGGGGARAGNALLLGLRAAFARMCNAYSAVVNSGGAGVVVRDELVGMSRDAARGAAHAGRAVARTLGEIANAEPSLVYGDERWVDRVEYHLCCFDDLDGKLDVADFFLSLERLSVVLSCLLADSTIDRCRASSDNNICGNNSWASLSIEFRNVSFGYQKQARKGALATLAASHAAGAADGSGEREQRAFRVHESDSDNDASTADVGFGSASNAARDQMVSASSSSSPVMPRLLEQAQQQPSSSALVLRDISFTLRAGEILGIVGPSGRGKSTVLKLFLRIYDPSSGSIIVHRSQQHGSGGGGAAVDLADIADVRAWRRNAIAYVDQHPLISNDATIRHNVEFGRPLPHDVVDRALRDAGCAAFVQRLKRGADTVVGMRLSSGERQRLAIARAFARRAPLLLLDEATSALDAETEATVIRGCLNQQQQQSANSGASAPAVVIVAHRLATLKIAHRILVLDSSPAHDGDDGGGGAVVVGLGSHAELMQSCPQYQHMYQRQCILHGLGGDAGDSAPASASAAAKQRTATPTAQQDISLLASALSDWTAGAAANDDESAQQIRMLQQFVLAKSQASSPSQEQQADSVPARDDDEEGVDEQVEEETEEVGSRCKAKKSKRGADAGRRKKSLKR